MVHATRLAMVQFRSGWSFAKNHASKGIPRGYDAVYLHEENLTEAESAYNPLAFLRCSDDRQIGPLRVVAVGMTWGLISLVFTVAVDSVMWGRYYTIKNS